LKNKDKQAKLNRSLFFKGILLRIMEGIPKRSLGTRKKLNRSLFFKGILLRIMEGIPKRSLGTRRKAIQGLETKKD